jgi:superfamily II DNA or RNA helicase
LLAGDGKHRDQKALERVQIARKHFLAGLTTSKNVCRRLLGELHAIKTNKVLVFCGLTEQADAICKYSYHAKSEENFLPAFDAGDIRVLTVVGKVDRGINLVGVNNIIFESPVKSFTKFTQKSGRGRRLNVNEVLDIYYLIPYYKDKRGNIAPTIVKKWVYESTAKTNFQPQTYTFNE